MSKALYCALYNGHQGYHRMQWLMDFSKRAIFIFALLALPGCGNKGPLYLPEPEPPAPLPLAEPVQSPEAGP